MWKETFQNCNCNLAIVRTTTVIKNRTSVLIYIPKYSMLIPACLHKHAHEYTKIQYAHIYTKIQCSWACSYTVYIQKSSMLIYTCQNPVCSWEYIWCSLCYVMICVFNLSLMLATVAEIYKLRKIKHALIKRRIFLKPLNPRSPTTYPEDCPNGQQWLLETGLRQRNIPVLILLQRKLSNSN